MAAPAPAVDEHTRDPQQLRAIDVDLHHRISDWGAVAPFVPAGLRHRFTRKGGPPLARHGFEAVGRWDGGVAGDG